MSIVARTETAEQRQSIYRALTRRNRLVRLLRIGLPVIGAVVFLGLMLQLYARSLIPDFGFANITIDRDNLIVEAPTYSGASADGSVYSVSAAKARTSFANTDLINLTDTIFLLDQPSGSSFEARAASAQLHVSEELVVVDGLAYVEGSGELDGTLVDAEVDLAGEAMHSKGPVDLTMRGMNVKAASMSYDGATGRWTFSGATLLLNATPGEQAAGLRPSVSLPADAETTP